MNFEKIKESDEVELPLLLRSRLVGLVFYVKDKINSGEFAELSLAEIAKDNRMTIPQLMEFGFTKSNLVCHAVVSTNEDMIQKMMSLKFSELGKTLQLQINAYLLQMYHYDLAQLAFRIAVQSYAWTWSVVDEARVTNQAMKLMTPIYIAMHNAGFERVDARCQAIWALYVRGLRHAALSKGGAQNCLNSIQDALELIMESKK